MGRLAEDRRDAIVTAIVTNLRRLPVPRRYDGELYSPLRALHYMFEDHRYDAPTTQNISEITLRLAMRSYVML